MPGTGIPTRPPFRPPQELLDRRNDAQCEEFMAQVRAHLKAAEQHAEFMKAEKEGLPYTRGSYAVYCPPHARKRANEDKAREEKKEERRVTRGRRVKVVRKTRRGQWAGKDHARKEREEARRANKEKRAKEETAKEMAKLVLKDVKKWMKAIRL